MKGWGGWEGGRISLRSAGERTLTFRGLEKELE